MTEGEWFEGMEVWNQVFRIRYSPRQNKQVVTSAAMDENKIVHAKLPPVPLPLSLNLTHHTGSTLESSESDDSESEGSVPSPLVVTVEKPGSLARGDWENFQSKLSRQLLARYFYSCKYNYEHMNMHKQRKVTKATPLPHRATPLPHRALYLT